VRRRGPYVSVVPTGSETTIFSNGFVDPIRDHRNAVAFTYSAVIAAGSTFSILLTRTPVSTSVRAYAASAEGLSVWRNLWAQFETPDFPPFALVRSSIHWEDLSSWKLTTDFPGLLSTQLERSTVLQEQQYPLCVTSSPASCSPKCFSRSPPPPCCRPRCWDLTLVC
jgi:hypothetical protein